MNRTKIMEKVLTIFQDVFDDPSLKIQDQTCSADIEEWDSMQQINLILAIQQEFDIKFSIEEAGSLKNVGEIVNLISTKLS